MQNSNFQDLVFNALVSQVASLLGTWTSTDGTSTPVPYNEGVTCRPDNFWYSGCGGYPVRNFRVHVSSFELKLESRDMSSELSLPRLVSKPAIPHQTSKTDSEIIIQNTQTGSTYGANVDFEACLTTFFSPDTAQLFQANRYGTNPTLPTGQLMGSEANNVTVTCPTNSATVDLIINVAFAPGCLPQTSTGLLNISDPIGDGSINGADVLRGTFYGCEFQGSLTRLKLITR